MTYNEGPGHLWEAKCTQCGHAESGTFSPAFAPDPEMDNIVQCHVKLHDISEISKLKRMIPKLTDKSSKELLNELKAHNLCWNLGSITMGIALGYKRLGEEEGIDVVVKP